MNFLDLAKQRFSVRKYQDRPVEREKLLQVIEAARVAPSAVNYQPVHFIIVDDKELKSKISTVYNREWFASAPAVIVACGDHDKSWKRADGKDHCDIDVAIAVDHITLAATEAGLGTCWVCAFDAKECHRILNLPDNLEPIVLLPIGYPLQEVDAEKHLAKRKELKDMISWNGYNKE